MSDIEDAKSGPKPPPGSSPAHGRIERRVSEPVVGGTLLGILQGLVGLVELLEFLLGGLVAGVVVGVVILGELAECVLELLIARASLDAKDFIVVAFCHRAAGPFAGTPQTDRPGRRSGGRGVADFEEPRTRPATHMGFIDKES